MNVLTATDFATGSTTQKSPLLPPLYFQRTQDASTSAALSALGSRDFHSLPAELLSNVTSFLDWGDLSRLACVQSSYRTVVRDAADYGGHDSKWELSCALLDESNNRGLAVNPSLAIEYLMELAGEDGATNNAKGDTLGNEEVPNTQKRLPFAPAMRKLATCYLIGSGVVKDTQLGLVWLKAAFVRGNDVDAAYQVAVLYEYGGCDADVEVDVVLAADWFRRAAQGGHVDAMVEYGMCCELGCGREVDDEEALEWYTQAAELGHVTANYSVGECFEEARGVPQSDEEACLWYYKAAAMGDEDSKKALMRLRDIARIVLPGWAGTLDV